MALPDFPGLKKDISRLLEAALKDAQIDKMRPFDVSPHIIIREGGDGDFSTVDGEIRKYDLHPFSVEFNLDLSSLAHMSHEDVMLTVIKIGQEFGEKISREFLDRLGKTVEAAGNSHDLRGREITSDDFFSLLEKIEISFNADGSPKFPTLVAHPNAKIWSQIKRISAEDDFRARLSGIIQNKQEEWNARESNRKLVD